ncbi:MULTISPECIES: HAD hydrolase family protein [unclassified Nodosilinea]|uniref:HAD hydrolase family protein n=1 Tax=Leptolyngbya subtilissima DQ-A4 TaxID=2933933 RepID=A0ABV0KDC4_9CYAN|nr:MULTISPECIES: HAD hydrolase family protein [unclassified Nodosilinea]MBD2108311.1 HAD hydrolase family protein [Nodosilinea sp. FACHB-13]MBD2111873.1 HAD hydrolase family protein [Nodosilinea sp. FACHB-141]
MIDINIPGFRHLQLSDLVLDYNGTLATDGRLIPQVGETLAAIAEALQIHVITADTFGLAQDELAGLPLSLTIAPPENQAETKLAYVSDLGTERVVAIGNGRNDGQMLKAAALGIALVQSEGGAVETLVSADVVSTSILDALELLRQPRRLVATLRS